MKKIILSLLAFFLLLTISDAQNQPESYCGYHGKSEWLKKYQQNPDAYPKRKSGVITYLPMAVHVLGRDDGTGYFPPRQILDALCTLNADLEDAEIQFYLEDDFNYIDNSEWFEHDFRGGSTMMRDNRIDGFVNSFIVGDPAGNCGYYSPGRDALAISKSCSGINDHTWAHEVGHLLSLPHPFVGWEGTNVVATETAPNTVNGNEVEKLDRSNCRNAADGFCDTYPDYISNRWSCNNDGESRELIDPNGVPFRADGSLIMSYSNDACANRFSSDQTDAMHANIQDERQDLLKNPNILADVDLENGVVPITPAIGEAVATGQTLISWEPVKNATHYYVEISVFPNMAVLLERKIVSTTEFLTDALTFERPHFWRVRPFNYFDFCTSNSDIFTFDVSSASSTKTIKEIESFVVAPVPAERGSDLLIQLATDKAFSINASLISLTGQVLKTEAKDLNAGQHNFKFGLPDVASGVYILSLQNDKGERLIKRVVVN